MAADELLGTWVFYGNPCTAFRDYYLRFSSNGIDFNSISLIVAIRSNQMIYTGDSGEEIAFDINNNGWVDDSFRTITITDYSSLENRDEFIAWLKACAIKQRGNTSSITYGGQILATLSEGQTATLACAGKIMKTDVMVALTGSTQ